MNVESGELNYTIIDFGYGLHHDSSTLETRIFLTSIPNKANHSCVVFGIVTKFQHSKFRTYRYNTIFLV